MHLAQSLFYGFISKIHACKGFYTIMKSKTKHNADRKIHHAS